MQSNNGRHVVTKQKKRVIFTVTEDKYGQASANRKRENGKISNKFHGKIKHQSQFSHWTVQSLNSTTLIYCGTVRQQVVQLAVSLQHLHISRFKIEVCHMILLFLLYNLWIYCKRTKYEKKKGAEIKKLNGKKRKFLIPNFQVKQPMCRQWGQAPNLKFLLKMGIKDSEKIRQLKSLPPDHIIQGYNCKKIVQQSERGLHWMHLKCSDYLKIDEQTNAAIR